MKKLFFKSTEADLQKLFSILETLQKNVLYSTYRQDKCLDILKSLQADTGVQKQVDDFYETSPQTDNEDKEPD